LIFPGWFIQIHQQFLNGILISLRQARY